MERGKQYRRAQNGEGPPRLLEKGKEDASKNQFLHKRCQDDRKRGHGIG